jgi:hypothetical protein
MDREEGRQILWKEEELVAGRDGGIGGRTERIGNGRTRRKECVGWNDAKSEGRKRG